MEEDDCQSSDVVSLPEALNLAMQHHSEGRLPEAESIYRKILHADPDQPIALHLLGIIAQQVGKSEDAVKLISKAVSIKPDYAEAYSNLGSALKSLGRLQEAAENYNKAIGLNPGLAEAHNNLGNALKEMDSREDAVVSYQKALSIKPDYADAHNNLIEVLEMSNRIEEMRKAIQLAKQNCPDDSRLALGEAQLLKRDGDFEAARAVLEKHPEPSEDARFLASWTHLLGDLCDRLEDCTAAFSYYSSSNTHCSETPEARKFDAKQYLNRIGDLEEYFTTGRTIDWQPIESKGDQPDPVFLVGFPRSGTTLLNTILQSHSRIAVVDEKPCVQIMQEAFVDRTGGDPASLENLDPSAIAELRQIYFEELKKYVDGNGRSSVVVDKQPLNFVEAGLIQRIFPEARFVFVQRHPCDCVLSCFMQNFSPNSAMVNFFDLPGAAHLYDKTMSLWAQYQKILPLNIHTIRYETLIDSFEETLSPTIDFLGLEWDEGLRDYEKTALQSGKISTPSYSQVTQPLYTRARGRWEKYREQMKPVLPTLSPWVKKQGYEV